MLCPLNREMLVVRNELLNILFEGTKEKVAPQVALISLAVMEVNLVIVSRIFQRQPPALDHLLRICNRKQNR